MKRSPQSLGYKEKPFDGCRFGMERTKAGCARYFSVVHFKIVCRDTEGTTESVASNFTPVVTDSMEFHLAGTVGTTRTDSQGLGQVQVVSTQPTKGKRFILVLGRHSLGLEVGQVTQIIVPSDWCER
jgi:hypothetical protein